MRWVDIKNYIGMDRRKRRPTLRLCERRRAAQNTVPPSLAAALRQLRVRALATNTPGGVADFVGRARAVADLAQAYGATEAEPALQRLADQMSSNPKQDWREFAEATLRRLAGASVSVSD